MKIRIKMDYDVIDSVKIFDKTDNLWKEISRVDDDLDYTYEFDDDKPKPITVTEVMGYSLEQLKEIIRFWVEHNPKKEKEPKVCKHCKKEIEELSINNWRHKESKEKWCENILAEPEAKEEK